MKILIVGLGLIGGSLAKALSAYTDAKVVGMDKDDKTLALALDEGAIRYIAGEPDLEDADVTILCLTPQNIINFVKENHEKMNKNGLVLDVCGVKRDIMACFREYFRPNGPQYIGMHPMAGRELFGYEHALVNLFQGASLVMTKDPELDYDVDWQKLEEYVYALGFRKLVPSTPETHDQIIAYTSQLAHVVSSAYIKSPTMLREEGYSAGSFRDLTRVARLDEKMWTDLFLRNADFLVDEIDEIFDAVGDPAAFGEVVAAIEELGAAHAELDGKSGTDGFADACEHFARKAQAIFQAAAVFVGAMVEIWREELIDEPAVAAVDHDHLKTGALGEGGFFAVGLDDIGDLFFCQSLHRNAVWTGAVARAILTEAGFFILVDEIGAGVLAAVGKLDAWHGAVAFDAVGEIGEAGEEPWRLQIKVEHMGTVGGWMHDKLAGGDGGGAAFGAQLVEAWRAWTDAAIGGDVGAAHRRCKDAVAEGHLAEGDRAAQVWK